MNKKRKLILTISGITIGLVLLFAVKFILDLPYKKQLPSFPDFSSVSKPIQEQIKSANRFAYLFTTAGNIGTLGMVYYANGYSDKAALCFQLASRKSSSKWIWTYYLGYLNLEKSDLNSAIENFNAVTAKDPQNYLAFYYAGEAYQNSGLTNNAEKIFNDIVHANDRSFNDKLLNRENYFPLKTYAKFQLARIYMDLNRLDSAKTILEEIIDEQMAFGPAYRALGNVYKLMNNLPLANKYAIRGGDLDDYIPPVDVQMDKIIRMSRSDQFLLKHIDDAIRTGNYKWALTLCDQAMNYFPENKYLLSKAIVQNFGQGNDKKALSYLDQHFKYFSDDPKEMMDVTDLLYDKGYGEEALRYFYQVKKLMPLNSALAVWLYDRGKKQEAVELLNGLIKKEPNNIKFLEDFIRISLDMGDDDLAKEYLSKLNAVAPSSVEAYKITGWVAERRSDIKDAISNYEKAFKIDPKNLAFTEALIDMYIRDKNWEMAINHSRQALEIYPNDATLLQGLGQLLITCPDRRFKNMEEGLEYSERAFTSNKSTVLNSLSAGKNLATAYVFLGNKKKAVKFINLTISLAKKVNKSDEYTEYFKNLVARKE